MNELVPVTDSVTAIPSLRVADLDNGEKAIIIRTSDRIAFKQCRRKWTWSSHLKSNLGSTSIAGPLWFGSAIHYALEDYHGYKAFDRAADAFRAYCIATSKQHLRDLPEDANGLYSLGVAMMDYYEDYWLERAGRPIDETFWFPDPVTGEMIPGVEVNFEIPIPLDSPHISPLLVKYAKEQGATQVLYRGTIDRVAIDEYGRLWIVEYKTAKVAAHMHYETDPQVTTYVWALSHLFPDHQVAGVIYMQFIKNEPKPPRFLASGKISTASNLATSAPLYQQALIDMYGELGKAPEANRKYLIDLMQQENADKDRYIVRAKIERNAYQLEAEAIKILMELEDMLNPNLPLYPNPTRDCSRMCNFMAPCIALDAGADFEDILAARYADRDQEADRLWRRRMPSPQQLRQLKDMRKAELDLESMQVEIQARPVADQEAIARGELEARIYFQMDD